MNEKLFKKAVCITDLHFGRSGNSITAHKDNLDFLTWLVDEAKTWGAETCIMMGDWHDNRHSIGVLTIHASLMGLDIINNAFDNVYMIPGNHDLPYRDKRDGASVEFARNHKNITIFRDPTNIGGCTFLPWLIGEEHKSLKEVAGRYVFAHLEMPGFLMNARVEMPDGPETVKEDQFEKNVEYIFTGHFHFRQHKNRVIYTGNIMPFNYTDANDTERGAMFLEWGKDPEFRTWPEQPLYRTCKLSELLDDPSKIIKPKSSIRVTVDMPINYEERQAIRDNLASEYGARKIEIGDGEKVEVSEGKAEIVHHSVDQTVVESLMAVDSAELSPEKLVKIYTNLPV